jgi:hypothetical protein
MAARIAAEEYVYTAGILHTWRNSALGHPEDADQLGLPRLREHIGRGS